MALDRVSGQGAGGPMSSVATELEVPLRGRLTVNLEGRISDESDIRHRSGENLILELLCLECKQHRCFSSSSLLPSCDGLNCFPQIHMGEPGLQPLPEQVCMCRRVFEEVMEIKRGHWHPYRKRQPGHRPHRGTTA